MNIDSLDIRLLRIFEAVMRERSVSRAAQEVGASQPAVSRALNTLRHLFKDELFVRSPSGMMPTSRALDLAMPIHDVLMRLQAVMEPAGFVPMTAKRTFYLAVSDHCATLILPELEARLRRDAPGIELRIRPKLNPAIVPELDAGEIDFAIGVMDEPPGRMRHITLFQEAYVCIMRRSHPLADRAITYEDFVAADHLAITHVGEATQVLDRLLEKRGVSRRIALTINQSLLAPEILERSDLILTTFVHTACCLSAFANLHVTDVPMKTDAMPVRLVWHDGLVKHPAHEWLRDIIVDICKNIKKRPSSA